ncbi:MAG: hypothetical protein AB7T10_01895 [bacterium]
MTRKIFLILTALFICVFSYTQDFTLSNGDEIKITILSDFEGLEFRTSINKNGNLFLYKTKQDYANTAFDMKLDQNLQNEANLVAFEKIHAEGITVEELKLKIAEVYDKVLVVKDIEIELLNVKERVYFDFGDQIAYRRFVLHKTYREILGEFQSGINLSTDSIYVRNGTSVSLKSIDDTLVLGDYIYIKKDIVFVTGEIKYPKALPYNPNFAARDYIALSGGITHYGSFLGIRVKEENGKLKSINSRIMPGDEIYIPANYLAYIRDFNTILQIVANVVTSLIVNKIINF